MPTDNFARLLASRSNQAAMSILQTNAAAAATALSGDRDCVSTSGFQTAGDMGGALYKRVATQPSHAGKFQSADGSWWEIAELQINPRMFGAKFDGVTDDTDAINAAITSLVAISGSFTPAASFTLQLPPGRAITRGGHVIPSGIKVRVVGAGAYTTILYQKNGANAAFLLDIQGQYCSVEQLSINGNRDNNPTGTDCLRMNADFLMVDRVLVAEASNDGILVGNLARSLGSRLRNVDVRYCKGYGINVVNPTGSTDCQFTDVNVGTSGKSGFFIGASAQKLASCHSWGNGIESATDNHGFNIVTGFHMLVGCEAESNVGRGVYIGTGVKQVAWSGGTIWGNASGGLYAFNASHCTFTGTGFRNNGVNNIGGSSSIYFAHICLETCVNMAIIGNTCYDDGTAYAAGTYRTVPPFPYPGRTAIATTSRCYAEGTGSNNNVITNNVMVAAQTRSGVSIQSVGVANRYANNVTGETALPTLASAASITLTPHYDLIQITGTTAITAIAAAHQGRRVTLQFATAGCVVTAGTNILIGTSYTSTAGGTLSLMCDGTNWYRQ